MHAAKTVCIAAIIAVAMWNTASGQTQPRTAGALFSERFDRLDRNGDGKLSQRELDRGTVFRMLDTDKNGLLTREDFLKIAELWRAAGS